MTNRYDLTPEAYERAFATFKAAVARAPTQIAFANICRCTQGNISQLLSNGSLLPDRFVAKVEAATGIPRHDLRPDLFPVGAGVDIPAPEVRRDRPAALREDAA